jgi:hypothetical protein
VGNFVEAGARQWTLHQRQQTEEAGPGMSREIDPMEGDRSDERIETTTLICMTGTCTRNDSSLGTLVVRDDDEQQ